MSTAPSETSSKASKIAEVNTLSDASVASKEKPAGIPSVTLNNGRTMPLVGLGTWQSKPDQVGQIVKDAIDLGYRHFDCAYAYKNEGPIGEGIEEKIEEGVVTREDLFITSKLWDTYHAPELVEVALRKTLSSLRLDYVDLYLIHWPMGLRRSVEGEEEELWPRDEDGALIFDEVDIVDTWRAMESLVTDGLAKSIGISNFNMDQINRILNDCTIKPVVNQIECHPYLNQVALQDFCKGKEIFITAYAPLGSGNRPWKKHIDAKILEDPKVLEMATTYEKSPAQIVLRFLVQRDILVIPKTANKDRLIENMEIFDFELSPSDMAVLFGMDCNGRNFVVEEFREHKYYPFVIPHKFGGRRKIFQDDYVPPIM